ncbi:GroES-like protein [Cenococcum geophilum 1.58]|uniref:GroES-like protein n=1 Tax=Cenococcum geophilum 1.58 TaxID=794803 RepID=UPI00358FF58A|nr:GroES-like protein [Cenococcum geophilum 1.58]
MFYLPSNLIKTKAVHYEGPIRVSVKEIEAPTIQHPNDAIIKVTTAAICGSDLHMYQDRTAAEAGDRIVLPFNVADGRCRNCEEGRTAFCTGVNPGFAGGAYGCVATGPYQGGREQYLRVPEKEHEAYFALLANIFPTGWHGLVLAGFGPGESVAVFGARPVGLMAAYSAVIRDANRIFVVNKVPERLKEAKEIRCMPVDFTKSDSVDQIIKMNDGTIDRAVDAVGYQAVDSSGSKEKPNVGYVPADPGAPDAQSKEGQILISFGKLFEKGLSLSLIISGRVKPSFVVSHEINIDNAPGAYEKFDKRIDGYTKVLIHPNGPL